MEKDQSVPISVGSVPLRGSWTNQVEKVTKEIGENCKSYKWMHIFSAKKAKFYFNLFMYSTIILSPLGALFSTIAVVTQDDKTPTTTFQILGILSGFAAAITSTIVKYGKFEQGSGDHKVIAAKYASLEGNIRRQLSLYRKDRINAGKYLQWVSDSFDELFASSPLIHSDAYANWNATLGKSAPPPKEYGKTIDVETNTSAFNNVLSDVTSIDITCTEEEKEEKENIPPVNGEIPLENKEKNYNTIKRARYFTPELNRYGDGRMNYEINRM